MSTLPPPYSRRAEGIEHRNLQSIPNQKELLKSRKYKILTRTFCIIFIAATIMIGWLSIKLVNEKNNVAVLTNTLERKTTELKTFQRLVIDKDVKINDCKKKLESNEKIMENLTQIKDEQRKDLETYIQKANNNREYITSLKKQKTKLENELAKRNNRDDQVNQVVANRTTQTPTTITSTSNLIEKSDPIQFVINPTQFPFCTVDKTVCYTVVRGSYKWSEGNSVCKDFHSKSIMAEVYNSEESLALSQILSEAGGWLGGSKHRGYWSWASSENKLYYTDWSRKNDKINWQVQEPSGDGSCIATHTRWKKDGLITWNDAPCHWNNSIVCELRQSELFEEDQSSGQRR